MSGRKAPTPMPAGAVKPPPPHAPPIRTWTPEQYAEALKIANYGATTRRPLASGEDLKLLARALLSADEELTVLRKMAFGQTFGFRSADPYILNLAADVVDRTWDEPGANQVANEIRNVAARIEALLPPGWQGSEPSEWPADG